MPPPLGQLGAVRRRPNWRAKPDRLRRRPPRQNPAAAERDGPRRRDKRVQRGRLRPRRRLQNPAAPERGALSRDPTNLAKPDRLRRRQPLQRAAHAASRHLNRPVKPDRPRRRQPRPNLVLPEQDDHSHHLRRRRLRLARAVNRLPSARARPSPLGRFHKRPRRAASPHRNERA